MPSETVSSSTSTAKALAGLTLPAPARLAPAQVRGAACVWCAEELHGGTAVDLGQRFERIVGVYGRWFPRGCEPCTLQAVLAECKAHPGSCEQCTDDPTLCERRRGLRALALELRA